MNVNNFDPCLPSSFEDEIENQDEEEIEQEHRFHQAITHFPSVNDESEVEEDGQDDDIQIALARSYEENEEVAQVAEVVNISKEQQEEEDLLKAISESEACYEEERKIRDLLHVSKLTTNQDEDEDLGKAISESEACYKEERKIRDLHISKLTINQITEEDEDEDLVKAISESQASYEQERQKRDLLSVSEQRTNQTMMRQQGNSTLFAPVEEFEDMLGWVQDVGNEDSYDECEGEHFPELYRNYRIVPTLFSDEEMWPPSAIRKQLFDLQVDRGVEDVREWHDSQSEDERCLVCLTNVATRIAVPCGHRLSCRPCLSSLVRQNNYYSVTAADGQVVQTDRRVPILCCTCRTIIGQIVTVH